MKRLDSPASLLASLPRGSTLALHSAFAEPRGLAQVLAEHSAALDGARLLTLMPMGESPYARAVPASHLSVCTFFPGKGLRSAVGAGRAHALRYPLSAIPSLFDKEAWRVDALLLQVSPPDHTGHVSLGLSVDYMRAVLAQRPLVVAEINPRVPHTCGDTRLPCAAIDWYIDAWQGPQEAAPMAADAVDARIARHVAGLVRDGAVLQIGIGSLPDQVLANLGHLKHLGVHSGIVTDAIRPLVESGVIDNSTKREYRGVSVATMAGGSQGFYDFLDRNEDIEFHPCSMTHNAQVLAGIDGLCAINSVLQVDLAGNANAETVAGRRISMPGGLPDFAAGARRAKDGLSIVALRSTWGSDAASSIVVELDVSEPTLTADEIDFVVTEYGVAALHGSSGGERVARLAAIAHPAHRESLARWTQG